MPEPLRHLRIVVDPAGEVIPGCPRCSDAEAEAETWRGRVLELERKVKQMEDDREAKLRARREFPEAEGLFNEWKKECGHPDARFDPRRIQLAVSAIRRYKDRRVQLSWVIQYGKHLAWVDPKGTKHDRFGLLFQDSEHIEKYARAWFIHKQRLDKHGRK
jgi:hypothetical protein